MTNKRVKGKKEIDGVFKFKSPFTGEYVMQHQYIAEVIIKRKAEKDKVPLTFKFWNDKEHIYFKEFRSQVTQAAKLCKKHNAKVIVKTLNELFWCFSLRNQKFLDKLEKNGILNTKREQESKERTIETTPTDKAFISKVGKKESLLNKMRKSE